MYYSWTLEFGRGWNYIKTKCDDFNFTGQTNSLQLGKVQTDDDRIKELRDILKSIGNIRKDVSELREILSEKYAESVADNITNCAMQWQSLQCRQLKWVITKI